MVSLKTLFFLYVHQNYGLEQVSVRCSFFVSIQKKYIVQKVRHTNSKCVKEHTKNILFQHHLNIYLFLSWSVSSLAFNVHRKEMCGPSPKKYNNDIAIYRKALENRGRGSSGEEILFFHLIVLSYYSSWRKAICSTQPNQS